MSELPLQLIPPGVHDARARAFLEVLGRAQADLDPKRLLVRRVHEVASDVLPSLVVEFGAGEFLVDGLKEGIVRDVLANTWALKARKGTDAGVLFGLSVLGMKARWTQWWEASPQGEPDTYTCRVFIEEPVIDGDISIFSAGAQEAALNMIDAMKRWSQAGTFGLGLQRRGTVHMAARRRVVTRKTIAPFRETLIRAAVPATVGALSRAGRVMRFATRPASIAALSELAVAASARRSRFLRIA